MSEPDYSDVRVAAEVLVAHAEAIARFARAVMAIDPLDTSADDRRRIAEACELMDRALRLVGDSA